VLQTTPRSPAVAVSAINESWAQFYLDRGRRLFQQERDREALEELNRALFLSPYQAEAHLLVGLIHLRGGRYTKRSTPEDFRCGAAETAERMRSLAQAYLEAAEIALARGEPTGALALDPSSAEAKRVSRRPSFNDWRPWYNLPQLAYTQDDGFHEIPTERKATVFLVHGCTVFFSVVIFLCGVLVGRGVARRTRRFSSRLQLPTKRRPRRGARAAVWRDAGAGARRDYR